MTRSLFGKLALSYLALAAGILLTVGVAASIVIEHSFYEAKEREVQARATQLAQEIGHMWQTGAIQTDVLQRVGHFQEFTGSTVWIVDVTGAARSVMVSDASFTLSAVEPGDFRLLTAGEPWSARGWNDTFDQHMLSLGIPLPSNPILAGIVVHTPLVGVRTTLATIQRLLLYIGLVTFVAALLVCLPLSRHITWPLKRMITVVENMAAGEFGATISTNGFQEIELLSKAFNDLDKQLAETIDELNRVEALRRELVTNVSHELRTPLTGLQGFLELAAEPGTTPEEQHEYMAIAREETERLHRLTEDLLRSARAQTPTTSFQPRPTDVAALLTTVFERTGPKMTAKQLRGSLDVARLTSYAQVDADRLDQVITNLLDNAVRHTPPGGTIALHGHTDDDNLTISVTDNGEGIVPDELPFIWERFFKGNRSRTTEAGSGLGLAIAKEIVHRHNGTIDVTSEIDAQTTFTVVLPLRIT